MGMYAHQQLCHTHRLVTNKNAWINAKGVGRVVRSGLPAAALTHECPPC